MRLRSSDTRGQALVEFSLIIPIFLAVLFSIIVLGLWVFYAQQTANAAREAARYASVHSASAQCPTVSRLDPTNSNRPGSYFRCDAPEAGWPQMTARARSFVWGMSPQAVHITACWSGFVDDQANADALPQSPNVFVDCTIGGVDPKTDGGSLACPALATVAGSAPTKADGDDKASATAFYNGTHYPTTVTVYVCTNWSPPLAGFLFVPATITIRSVSTQAIQRQQ